MISSYKKILRSILPPICIDFYFSKLCKHGYFGNHVSWERALEASTGYDADLILEKVKCSLSSVVSGDFAFERDSVTFDKIEYSWPLLLSMFLAAKNNDNRLSLIDFGGSLGSSFFQYKNYFPTFDSVSWNIIEQGNYVKCGKQFFETNELKFHETMSEPFSECSPNLIIFSASIQYIEDPYRLLGEAVNHNFDFLVFDRTPFFDFPDQIVVQRVPAEIYPASYPATIFNQSKFINFFAERGYKVVADFDADGRINLKGARFRGFIFERI